VRPREPGQWLIACGAEFEYIDQYFVRRPLTSVAFPRYSDVLGPSNVCFLGNSDIFDPNNFQLMMSLLKLLFLHSSISLKSFPQVTETFWH
jgi:hypothetical protein